MEFKVKNKETGELISPRNYYFVIKQNGELFTFNGSGKFEKANDKYEIIAMETRQQQSSSNCNIPHVSHRMFCINCLALHIFPSGKYRCNKNYTDIKEDIETHSCDYFKDKILS